MELSKVLDVYENLTNLILIQFPKTQYLTSSPPALVLVFVRGLGLERFLFVCSAKLLPVKFNFKIELISKYFFY